MSLPRFEILLDRPDDKFEPGEIVAGRLFVTLNAPQTIRGIKVVIEGDALVAWTEYESRIQNNQTVYDSRHMRSYERYVYVERYVLIGAIGSDEVEIQAGSYVFPFTFRLPFNIPNTFGGEFGKIAYYVKGIVDIGSRWKPNISTIKDFVVEAPHDLSQSPVIAVHDEESHSFCCLYFIDMGSMDVEIFMPTSVYAIGDTIEVKINMVNKSASVNLTGVKLVLEQWISFQASYKGRFVCNTIRTSAQSGAFSKMDEIVISLVIPTVHCSNATNHCQYIDSRYMLFVILKVSGCHEDIRNRFPIEIGTKSPRSRQLAQQGNICDAPIPTAGSLPLNSQTPMSTMPVVHNPRAFGIKGPTNSSNELNQVVSVIPNRSYGSISSTTIPTAPPTDE